MKLIKLTQGKSTIVDDDMFEYLNQWKWHFHTGYAGRHLYLGGGRKHPKRKFLFLHQLINNTPKGFETDHINRDKLDNRRNNLRTVTHSQNQHNITKQKNNKSGYNGVSFYSRTQKWRVYITVNNKYVFIGEYLNKIDAINARLQAEYLYWDYFI